jgi:hypothetical protein
MNLPVCIILLAQQFEHGVLLYTHMEELDVHQSLHAAPQSLSALSLAVESLVSRRTERRGVFGTNSGDVCQCRLLTHHISTD